MQGQKTLLVVIAMALLVIGIEGQGGGHGNVYVRHNTVVFLARSKNGLCDHYLSRCFFAITFERNGLGT
jgi:hypothetical protein